MTHKFDFVQWPITFNVLVSFATVLLCSTKKMLQQPTGASFYLHEAIDVFASDWCSGFRCFETTLLRVFFLSDHITKLQHVNHQWNVLLVWTAECYASYMIDVCFFTPNVPLIFIVIFMSRIKNADNQVVREKQRERGRHREITPYFNYSAGHCSKISLFIYPD